MRRFVQINGELHEITDGRADLIAPMVMPDIAPYRSMIDGSVIESRSQHREHLHKHNAVEIGNDSSLYQAPKGIPDVKPEHRKELIRSQIDALSHKEFRQMHERSMNEIRWNSRGR